MLAYFGLQMLKRLVQLGASVFLGGAEFSCQMCPMLTAVGGWTLSHDTGHEIGNMFACPFIMLVQQMSRFWDSFIDQKTHFK